MPDPARVLVVASRTADSDELHAALLERQAEGAIRATLLAPATWEVSDSHGGRESAQRRVNSARARLREAGLEVEGLVGDADPIAAVEATWDPTRFDEVIVATLPAQLSRWLRLDLPRRVERITGLKVRHVVAHERAAPGRGT